ncbi:hypothetical protein JTE90_011602 [Oedothorax gibbosus]|uniref:Uncharacterized protein n=1 Tax=Oedothorax gibbosus TaxID=931172 RepID=A0AAV6TEF7_9ARAC|nr:hypothetical protein JTE90_011602 [Oedothorax gibbosus]
MHGLRPGDYPSSVCLINCRWYCYAPTMVVTGDGESGFDSGGGPEKRLPPPKGKPSRPKITHPRNGEVFTKKTYGTLLRPRNWNGDLKNPLAIINWGQPKVPSTAVKTCPQ